MAMVSVFSDGVTDVDEVADGEGAMLHQDVAWTLRSAVRRKLQDGSPIAQGPAPVTMSRMSSPLFGLAPAFDSGPAPSQGPEPPPSDAGPEPSQAALHGQPSPLLTSPPAPLYDAGSAQPTPRPSGGKTGPSIGAIAGASAGVLVLSCLIILAVWFHLRRKRTRVIATSLHSHSPSPALEGEEFERMTGPRQFGYSEIAEATGFFSDEQKLGEGGFGSVYRGYLKETDVHVAVKRVSESSKQGKKEYAAEVTIISQLRHRNLVQLVGWCHENNELLLVYELMPNGSLDTHIHNEKVLPWSLRHEIVLGVGSALLYLHEGWGKCVLHRDIKPSNLMLDESFNVKLGDFGLARLVDHGQGSHTTMLMGTTGYMDPENMITGKASKESDVYSFGVVVLEIITGRRPILSLQGNQSITVHLAQLVWELYGDGMILDAADPRLNGEFDSKAMERMMVVALWCVHPDSSQRPSTKKAVNMMQSEAPLPNLPAKMPVTTFVLPPVESLLAQSLDTTGTSSSSGYGTGTTRSSSYGLGTTGSSSGGVSSLLR